MLSGRALGAAVERAQRVAHRAQPERRAAALIGDRKAVAADAELAAADRAKPTLPVPMIRIAPSPPPCAPILAMRHRSRS